MGANDLHAVATLDPWGRVIHYNKYISRGLMGFEKISEVFPISQWELKTTGAGQFGYDWQGLCRGTTRHCYKLNI